MTTISHRETVDRIAGRSNPPRFWFLGTDFTILANQSSTEGQYDLIEGRPPAGYQTPLHRHTRYSEQLYVLDGEMTVRAGAQTVVLHAGQTFIIPVGTAHAVENTGGRPAHGLVIAFPSGFARMIEEVGTPYDGGTPPETTPAALEHLDHVAIELGDEILGPPGAHPKA